MRVVKFIIRNVLKIINNIIDFLNYGFNFNLTNLPKFPEEK